MGRLKEITAKIWDISASDISTMNADAKSKAVATDELPSDCRLGLRQHFCWRCPISKPRPVLDFSSKTLFIYLFFAKSQNELVWQTHVFFAFLVPELIIVR